MAEVPVFAAGAIAMAVPVLAASPPNLRISASSCAACSPTGWPRQAHQVDRSRRWFAACDGSPLHEVSTVTSCLARSALASKGRRTVARTTSAPSTTSPRPLRYTRFRTRFLQEARREPSSWPGAAKRRRVTKPTVRALSAWATRRLPECAQSCATWSRRWKLGSRRPASRGRTPYRRRPTRCTTSQRLSARRSQPAGRQGNLVGTTAGRRSST